MREVQHEKNFEENDNEMFESELDKVSGMGGMM